MTLQGKGFFLFELSQCEGGDPAAIVTTAQAAGLSHVIIKVADGERAFGIDASGIDLTAPVVQALRTARIAAWGWHYIYGNKPAAEAAIAIARAQALGLDGYVVDAENEYQRPGMASAARQFMNTIRKSLTIPIALSSYRFPNYHTEFPWSTFLEFCDVHMPQVTWDQAHNAGEQLRESRRQCDALPNAKPFIPTGAAYTTSGWNPTTEDIKDFMTTAKALGLPAVNFIYWDTCRQYLPLLWTAISDFAWSAPATIRARTTPPIPLSDPFLSQYLAALNSRQAAQLSALYDPASIQVCADQILSNPAAIQTGYTTFFSNLPPGTMFTYTQAQIIDDMIQLSWKAGTLTGETTLLLKSGKIIQDYTFIS